MAGDQQWDDPEAWRAVARETLQAFDAIFSPGLYGWSLEEGGAVAVKHLERGRELLQPILDQYSAEARTSLGRAWRRMAVGRGPYVAAFDEALAHARARAAGETERDWPMLWIRDGRLPLLQRYTGDRRVLDTIQEEEA
ncbi:hypothetical protein OS965_30090 [Streptomyces sp. H27-G5]|uniref:hypothetical protein n=1 Tax=Streptomyces sp. H27-G5 TaxID=2996698 RepID=UPI0022705D34|nr:hypothetical protein [Streptomyces sp. H27-G5]MCY0922361.1 hypothetical protein [Streptomyces sp. H27-G5]